MPIVSYDYEGARRNYGIDIDYSGTALNPATGKREQVFAVYGLRDTGGMDPGAFTHDWTDFRFASDPRGLSAEHVSMYGFSPGYRAPDPASDFDRAVEIAVVGGLAAIGGVAAGAAFGVGPAASSASSTTVTAAESSAGLVYGGMDGAAISSAELFAMPAAQAEVAVTASGGWIDAALEGAKSFLKSPLAGAGLSFLASERALDRADRARQDALAAQNVPMTAPDVVLRGSPNLPVLGSKTTSALDLTAWLFFAFAVILVLFFVRKS